MRVGRASSEMDTPRLEFHDEEKIEGYQPALGPDFDGGEIDGAQHVPMGLEKSFPGGLTFPLGRRLNAVRFEDIAHRLIGHIVVQVGQGTLDPVESPIWILLG